MGVGVVTVGGIVDVTTGVGVGFGVGVGLGGLNAKHAAQSGFGSHGSFQSVPASISSTSPSHRHHSHEVMLGLQVVFLVVKVVEL